MQKKKKLLIRILIVSHTYLSIHTCKYIIVSTKDCKKKNHLKFWDNTDQDRKKNWRLLRGAINLWDGNLSL